MLVPMMEVREVSVLVVYGLMKVFMRVRLGSVGSRDVLILVMFIRVNFASRAGARLPTFWMSG